MSTSTQNGAQEQEQEQSKASRPGPSSDTSGQNSTDDSKADRALDVENRVEKNVAVELDLHHLEPTKTLYGAATLAFAMRYPSFQESHPVDHASQFRKLVISATSVISTGWPDIQRSTVYTSLLSSSSSILAGTGTPQCEEMCNDVIDFALRIWVMVDCSRLVSSGISWSWPAGVRIQDFVEGDEGWFVRASKSSSPDGSRPCARRFPPGFTAAKLEKVSDVKIKWTKRLSDHLLLNEQEDQVSIFGFREWLEQAREGSTGLPNGLLDETLRTLSVLFPLTDAPTQDWITRMKVPELRMDRNVQARWRAPSLRDFDFWRERLLDLVEKYQAPPRNPKSIWRDRRNPVSFATFWIGLIIFFATLAFGLIASVLAGVTISDGRGNHQAEAISSLAAAIEKLADAA